MNPLTTALAAVPTDLYRIAWNTGCGVTHVALSASMTCLVRIAAYEIFKNFKSPSKVDKSDFELFLQNHSYTRWAIIGGAFLIGTVSSICLASYTPTFRVFNYPLYRAMQFSATTLLVYWVASKLRSRSSLMETIMSIIRISIIFSSVSLYPIRIIGAMFGESQYGHLSKGPLCQS
jgi:hypothetical protein